MHPNDEEMAACRSSKGVFCLSSHATSPKKLWDYVPSSHADDLKEMLGDVVEFYIDDLVVK